MYVIRHSNSSSTNHILEIFYPSYYVIRGFLFSKPYKVMFPICNVYFQNWKLPLISDEIDMPLLLRNKCFTGGRITELLASIKVRLNWDRVLLYL